MSCSGIQWGTVGEWVSGVGALAAVGAAFVIQHRDHKRQDKRDQTARDERKLEDRRRLLGQVRNEVEFDLRHTVEGIGSGEASGYTVFLRNGTQETLGVDRYELYLAPAADRPEFRYTPDSWRELYVPPRSDWRVMDRTTVKAVTENVNDISLTVWFYVYGNRWVWCPDRYVILPEDC